MTRHDEPAPRRGLRVLGCTGNDMCTATEQHVSFCPLRHDEPAEGDVAGVEVVLAAHIAHWSPTISPRAECSCGEWQKALLTDDAIEDAHRAHVADALRDLFAAAEQRGRDGDVALDHLVIPLDYTFDRDDQLNKGKAYVEVPIEYDADLPTRGERRVNPYGPCPIVLRESNQQVLLHEILHVVIAGYGRPDDPHEHRLVNRVEVALWETGWRMGERGVVDTTERAQ